MSGFGEEFTGETLPISPRRRKLMNRPVEIERERKSGPTAGGSVGGEIVVAEDSFPVLRRLRRGGRGHRGRRERKVREGGREREGEVSTST